jgi:predicted kinase
MADLIMMVGLPGCGKSTYVRQTAKPEDLILSTDAIIYTIAEKYDFQYDECFKLLIDFADKVMYRVLQQWLVVAPSDANVWWDQTNLTLKSRHKKLIRFDQLVAQANIKRSVPLKFNKVAFHVNTPFGVCAARQNERTDKRVSLETLTSMNEHYKAPIIEEGFDMIAFPPTHGNETLS